MNKRILLAGVVAGIALFAWESMAHMLTPLGAAGFKALPDEAATMTTLKAAVQESGLFFFPAPKPGQTAPPEGTPTGILMINRHGTLIMTPRQLATQLGFDMLAMLIAALILTRMAPDVSFGAKLLVALAIALFPTLRSDGPLWNWYGFPKTYVAAQLVMNLIGFAIGGAIVAKMSGAPAKAKAAAA